MIACLAHIAHMRKNAVLPAAFPSIEIVTNFGTIMHFSVSTILVFFGGVDRLSVF